MDIDRDDEILINLAASVDKQNITTSSDKYHIILRKSLEFFLIISLLSLLLSLYTGVSYLQSCAYYLSTFFFPFVAQVLQRKYMFLLCNGILVFLAALSGFWGASSNTQLELSEVGDVQGEMKIIEDDSPYGRVSLSSTTIAMQEKEKLQEEVEEKLDEEDDKEDRIEDGGTLEEEEDEDEDEEEEEMVNASTMVTGVLEGEENDETESEDPASINAEELNRKIEEFIRKMKDELRLEAQQHVHHLIAV